MARAGIFIGVDRTGTLQVLHDAASGAARMHAWALEQGMPDKTHAKLITDAGGKKVGPSDIYDAIKEIIDGPGVDQLILYFAGHGVNINRGEQWLLTDAPVNTGAAVNVKGSVDLARYCGIQNVVVISDACRSAPEGIQAQNVRGMDVFPNDGPGTLKPVDQFFACGLGRTAAEIKDPLVAAGNYSGLYTNAMLDAFGGNQAQVLEPATTPGDPAQYIRMWALEAYLEAELPRRILALNLATAINQSPEAIISSKDGWISRRTPPPGGTGPAAAPPVRGPGPPSPPPQTLRRVSRTLVNSATRLNAAAFSQVLSETSQLKVSGASQLVSSVQRVAGEFGPMEFETECGIKVRGARLSGFFAPRAQKADLFDPGVLRLNLVDPAGASVLLRFEGGTGAVVPIVPGFIAALTIDEGELVDVAFEPSANTWRWGMFASQAAEVRQLRAVAATSSLQGGFRLDEEHANEVAQRMQYAKGIDPTLAIYAAYAYYDLQAIERIGNMSNYLKSDIGVTFFDLELLSRRLVKRSIEPKDSIIPFVPLLSQGWALLSANQVRLHPLLEGIDRMMVDSVWTLFDGAALDRIEHAMRTGEVR